MDKKIDKFFDIIIRKFMIGDIDKTIIAKANFLAALGLSAYTEVLGGLVTGKYGQDEFAKDNYNFFLSYLGPEYVDLNKSIDLYHVVRCGLVHEYFIKKDDFTISIITKVPDKCGIFVDSHNGKLVFAVQNYLNDFRDAVEKYYDELSKNPKRVDDLKKVLEEKLKLI